MNIANATHTHPAPAREPREAPAHVARERNTDNARNATPRPTEHTAKPADERGRERGGRGRIVNTKV